MRIIQYYEEIGLYFYLDYIKNTENEQIRRFLEKNKLKSLCFMLLHEGHSFLYQRIHILYDYITKKGKWYKMCEELINSYILVENEQYKWYLIMKILVYSEMILQNQF